MTPRRHLGVWPFHGEGRIKKSERHFPRKKNNFAAIPADFNPLIIVLQLQEAGPATFKKPLIISRRSCKTILLLFPDFCLNNVFEAALLLRGGRMAARVSRATWIRMLHGTLRFAK